jgi:hypothetical protein
MQTHSEHPMPIAQATQALALSPNDVPAPRMSIDRMGYEDFFQGEMETEIKLQVRWLLDELDFTDLFFVRFLCINNDQLSNWLYTADTSLSKEKLSDLRELWELFKHFLSSYNRDAIKIILEYNSPQRTNSFLSNEPPWTGTTLREFLEVNRVEGVRKVDSWVQSLRFANYTSLS